MSTQQTIDLLKAMQPTQLAEDIAKSFSQATGLVFYDLQPAAKTLYPVLTPLRNVIPRNRANGGTATNWKQIVKVNTNNMRPGVSEGNRGGVIADEVQDKTAAYRGLGLENSVTYEADYAAENFDDARARASQSLLNSLFIQEEQVILGGNNSLALGTTPTPTAAGSNSGGSLAAATYSVICVALTHIAWKYGTVTGGLVLNATRTNADGSTDTVKSGLARKSAAATATVASGSTGSIAASVTPVAGAVAYAWFWGAAGSEALGAITTLNSVSITANAAGTQLASALPAADDSRDSLVYDGLLTQIMTSGSGSVVTDLATGTPGTGTALTSDGAGGISQVDTELAKFWDNSRLSPSVMWCSAKTMLAMNKLVIANGGAPLIRFNMDNGGNQTIAAGSVIGTYLNKITNQQIAVRVHPDMADGQIMFWSDSVPYPVANVGALTQMRMRQDYYQIEWPRRTRKYEFGVYCDGLLQMYFTPAFGLLKNIAV
ncbi:MAG: hypothetical protein RL758_53 [Pseudomonadota bacterium]|jgi:hypothetical protein